MLLLSFLPKTLLILHCPEDSDTVVSLDEADEGRPVSKSSLKVSPAKVQTAIRRNVYSKDSLFIIYLQGRIETTAPDYTNGTSVGQRVEGAVSTVAVVVPAHGLEERGVGLHGTLPESDEVILRQEVDALRLIVSVGIDILTL